MDKKAEETTNNENIKEKRGGRLQRTFPSHSLEEALKIPKAIVKNNAGNPWDSSQIAFAISMGEKSSSYYYYTTASRDYGMTTGTSRGKTIELTALGRKLLFPENQEQEIDALKEAFLISICLKKYLNTTKVMLFRKKDLFSILYKKLSVWILRFIKIF